MLSFHVQNAAFAIATPFYTAACIKFCDLSLAIRRAWCISVCLRSGLHQQLKDSVACSRANSPSEAERSSSRSALLYIFNSGICMSTPNISGMQPAQHSSVVPLLLPANQTQWSWAFPEACTSPCTIQLCLRMAHDCEHRGRQQSRAHAQHMPGGAGCHPGRLWHLA